MRLLTLSLTVVASASAAQTLTASGDLTFMLTTPLPITDLATVISGSGVVTLGCTPCASSANTQHFSFEGVQLIYEQAPTDPPAQTGAANQTDTTVTSVSYTLNNINVGMRVYPRLLQVSCSCGNGAQTSNLLNVDKTNLAVTINPFLESIALVQDASNTLIAYDPPALPKGTAMLLKPGCLATPKGNETLRVHVSGAGVDTTKDFPTSDAILMNGVPFTPTATGTITVTCALEPYDAVSNAQTVTVVDMSSGAGGGTSSGTGGGSSGTGGGAMQGGGCTQVPGAAAVVLALALVTRRRRSRAHTTLPTTV
jgi:hypothetical protein